MINKLLAILRALAGLEKEIRELAPPENIEKSVKRNIGSIRAETLKNINEIHKNG